LVRRRYGQKLHGPKMGVKNPQGANLAGKLLGRKISGRKTGPGAKEVTKGGHKESLGVVGNSPLLIRELTVRGERLGRKRQGYVGPIYRWGK